MVNPGGVRPSWVLTARAGGRVGVWGIRRATGDVVILERRRATRILERGPFLFFVGVVIVQGFHMFEHVVQLIQVFAWNVPDDDALGLLGYVFQLQGTEEWLHLVFNLALLTSLYILLGPIRAASPSIVPRWGYLVYLFGAAGLETWHEVEHLVIISRVLTNNGCPCPGIGDTALGVSDTVLHFVYNLVVYSAMLVPFFFVFRFKRRERDASGGSFAAQSPPERTA
jgi:hypothetical protein